jgi:chromosome segregation ATPase
MTEKEQNQRINQLRRQLTTMAERVKTLELDIEPEGRISEAFTMLEKHMDDQFAHIDENFAQVNRRLDRLEHQFNKLQSKLEVVLDFITGINDLPEE